MPILFWFLMWYQILLYIISKSLLHNLPFLDIGLLVSTNAYLMHFQVEVIGYYPKVAAAFLQKIEIYWAFYAVYIHNTFALCINWYIVKVCSLYSLGLLEIPLTAIFLAIPFLFMILFQNLITTFYLPWFYRRNEDESLDMLNLFSLVWKICMSW